MIELPAGAPATLGEAFAHIGAVRAPSLLDLKVMVLVEAAGESLYAHSATGTDRADVADLLHHNGREEMLHAHRVAQAIERISGEAFAPPAASENPYLSEPAPPAPPLTPEGLEKIAASEYGGESLYLLWADATENDEAAALFRLNGREERDHGDRLMTAAGLLRG